MTMTYMIPVLVQVERKRDMEDVVEELKGALEAAQISGGVNPSVQWMIAPPELKRQK